MKCLSFHYYGTEYTQASQGTETVSRWIDSPFSKATDSVPQHHFIPCVGSLSLARRPAWRRITLAALCRSQNIGVPRRASCTKPSPRAWQCAIHVTMVWASLDLGTWVLSYSYLSQRGLRSDSRTIEPKQRRSFFSAGHRCATRQPGTALARKVTQYIHPPVWAACWYGCRGKLNDACCYAVSSEQGAGGEERRSSLRCQRKEPRGQPRAGSRFQCLVSYESRI